MTTRTIWKYELHHLHEQEIKLKKGAEVLCVQVQFEKACIWVLVDPAETVEEVRTFVLYGTGHDIKTAIGTSVKYIGTFQLGLGTFIGHLFEKIFLMLCVC